MIMKIVVIGLGSMGRRRIRLLKTMGKDISIYGVDNNAERCRKASEEYGIATYASLKDALQGTNQELEAAVISTSPLSHAAIIRECLDANLHVFTELNLVSDHYADNIQKAKEKGRVLFLSSTFLYRDEVQYIQEQVKNCPCTVSYTYHVGQYLPDWHPWENYKDFFVGDKRTNGCRELFAIELPWLQKTFGPIASYELFKDKLTALNIEYPDTYHMLLRHESGALGSLQVDVISRKPVRNLEVYSESIYLTWDGTPTGLCRYNIAEKKDEKILLYNEIQHMEGYSAFVIENAYQNELVAFFEEISGKTAAKYSFEDDLKTIKLMDAIEGIL